MFIFVAISFSPNKSILILYTVFPGFLDIASNSPSDSNDVTYSNISNQLSFLCSFVAALPRSTSTPGLIESVGKIPLEDMWVSPMPLRSPDTSPASM